jgi:hypothetical protein
VNEYNGVKDNPHFAEFYKRRDIDMYARKVNDLIRADGFKAILYISDNATYLEFTSISCKVYRSGEAIWLGTKSTVREVKALKESELLHSKRVSDEQERIDQASKDKGRHIRALFTLKGEYVA